MHTINTNQIPFCLQLCSVFFSRLVFFFFAFLLFVFLYHTVSRLNFCIADEKMQILIRYTQLKHGHGTTLGKS